MPPIVPLRGIKLPVSLSLTGKASSDTYVLNGLSQIIINNICGNPFFFSRYLR